jgi:hypothetical protein
MLKTTRMKKTYGTKGRYLPVVAVAEAPAKVETGNNSLESTLDSSYMDDTFDKMRKGRY